MSVGLQKVCEIVAMQAGLAPCKVSAGLRLSEDLSVDSLDMQDLLILLEATFGVIPDAGQVAAISTVADLHAAIARAYSSKNAP